MMENSCPAFDVSCLYRHGTRPLPLSYSAPLDVVAPHRGVTMFLKCKYIDILLLLVASPLLLGLLFISITNRNVFSKKNIPHMTCSPKISARAHEK